jgi:hypothetical protein
MLERDGNTIDSHLPVRRVWDFVNYTSELTQPEYEHLSGCRRCLASLGLCIVSKTPDEAETNISRRLSRLRKDYRAEVDAVSNL